MNGNIVGNEGAGTIDLTTIIDINLADNGGPTLTHALVPGGPAVDGGANALTSTSTDQTGAPRILDGNADGTSVADIGAVELVTRDGLFTHLKTQIADLGDVGYLKMGEETSLFTLLTQSQNQYEQENLVGSIELLGVFVLRVHKLVDAGVLTEEQGESLTSSANKLMDQLHVVFLSASTEQLDTLFTESSVGSALEV